MHYSLSVPDSSTYTLAVECHLSDITTATVELQLPAWRPGRYELQNFAKNIQYFGVFTPDGLPLPFQKITKDRWLMQTEGNPELVVRYGYYTALATPNQQNAGSSFVSNEWLYVNPVNLCVYAEGRIHEPCTLTLDIPDDWILAGGLTQTGPKTLWAADFYELADSPFIASPTLQQISYKVGQTAFTVWVQGTRRFDAKRVQADFSRFSAAQIALFGEFPEADYHFLTIVLPTAYYHGVEHRNSTVLVLGPAEEGEGLYQDLLGVASHELFHAWNIIRIRPAELLPYDFTRENYFTTCFVAEGITTYYGDLILRRSGVFTDAAYLKELHVTMKRHFEGSRHATQSLLESSWDLWLDGYDKGVPNRKVSVYHKGALVSLILDLHLRRQSNHTRSLDDVMRGMWQQFGKPFVGYTLTDYRTVCETIAGESLAWYFDTCIAGTATLDDLLNEYLADVGLRMHSDETGGVLLAVLTDEAGAVERAKWLDK